MSATSEFRDEPRSWRELIVDAINRRATALYALGAVVFGLFAVVGVSMLIHIEVAPIGYLARIEAASGVSYADEIIMPGLCLNLTVYLLAFGACAWKVVEEVGGR